jgi:hypothetical protein
MTVNLVWVGVESLDKKTLGTDRDEDSDKF